MRWIEKEDNPPAPLVDYLQLQIPVGVNLDYPCFPNKKELRTELIRQQFGLCAFTGVPLDDRLGNINVSPDLGVRVQPHIAHLKPQDKCREELYEAGKEPGRDLGEDMDYNNMVAALEVSGTEAEQFGAAAAGNWWEPTKFVSPTQNNCEDKFVFKHSGTILETDTASAETIKQLRLDHWTLVGWRSSAIFTFINPENPDDFTEHYLQSVVQAMDTIANDKLPEYCFVIKNVAQGLLREMG